MNTIQPIKGQESLHELYKLQYCISQQCLSTWLVTFSIERTVVHTQLLAPAIPMTKNQVNCFWLNTFLSSKWHSATCTIKKRLLALYCNVKLWDHAKQNAILIQFLPWYCSWIMLFQWLIVHKNVCVMIQSILTCGYEWFFFCSWPSSK